MDPSNDRRENLSANGFPKNEELLEKPSNINHLAFLSIFLVSFICFPSRWQRRRDSVVQSFAFLMRQNRLLRFSSLYFHPLEIQGVLSQFTPISGKIGGSRLTTTTPLTGVSVRNQTGL